MKLVALYKTFDGETFVDASLRSVYDSVDHIVMVHSDVSWLGERGNTVRQAAWAWCEQNDKAGKVRHVDSNSSSQEAQYADGLAHIEKFKLADIIMVVDADEVWEPQYIENARRQIHDHPFAAYRCNMHTYLRSPFYRVAPPYGSPTVFLREFKHLTTSPRGCKAPARQLSDVWMHHFTAVRSSREEVARKIRQSCLADKNGETVVPGWMENVYDKLPAGENLHYFEKHRAKWKRVEKITMAELPPAMQKAKNLAQWWTAPAHETRTTYVDTTVRELYPGQLADAHQTLIEKGYATPPKDTHAVVMGEAAKIRDVAKRHAFVFDAGHSVADFFDVDKRMASEEFALLRKHVKPDHDVIEVGCYTGLNLIGLARLGHTGNMGGVDFVWGAVKWMQQNWPKESRPVQAYCTEFQNGGFPSSNYDLAILFDVLEHQRNAGQFLEGVARVLKPGGTALVLVPKGKDYYDCGHVGFFPDEECLRNVLDYVFEVETCYELASCNKIFAVCRKRAE